MRALLSDVKERRSGGQYEALLLEAGSEDPSIEPTRFYGIEDARSFLEQAALDVKAFADSVDESLMSAFVRARKPRAEATERP